MAAARSGARFALLKLREQVEDVAPHTLGKLKVDHTKDGDYVAHFRKDPMVLDSGALYIAEGHGKSPARAVKRYFDKLLNLATVLDFEGEDVSDRRLVVCPFKDKHRHEFTLH